MAKKKHKRTQKNLFQTLGIKNTKVKILAYFILGIFSLMASLGLAGRIGNFIHHKIFLMMFGYGFFVVPFLFFFAIWKIRTKTEHGIRDSLSLLGLILSILGLMHIFLSSSTPLPAGGSIGYIIGEPLKNGFDVYFSSLLLFGVFVASTIILFDPNFSFLKKTKNQLEKTKERTTQEKEKKEKIKKEVQRALHKNADEEIPDEETETKKQKSFSLSGIKTKKEKKEKELDDDFSITNSGSIFSSSYLAPPISLLGKSGGKPSTGDIKSNATTIQRTLMNFGIAVEMDEISVGPTVTRYALKPAQGVRLNRIAGLQNELALALAAKSIRIEAPIPGKSLVGIEVPNRSKSSIGLGSVLSEEEYQKSNKPLLVSLGKGVSGKSYFANLAKMPHALIAGATGSGKSVTIHNIVMSLLYKNGPDMLRFIMVDPKRVEMTLYKKIPHLLTPVITDPKKAVLALKWAVKEMERRYDLLQKMAVRDIDSYHKTIVAPAYKGLSPEEIEDRAGELPEKMPYIVVIIDELSDIMSSYPRELEAAIVRLAQMSRAVGIHLLLATQRPSVNVITGLIKANVPSRLALKVASQVDSRTILDSRGAEKLLGQGDMLYKGEGSNEPIRIQCPFVSEAEIKSVISYIQKNFKYELDDEIIIPDENLHDGGGGLEKSEEEADDPMYEEARAVVIASKKASTSYLQRRLSIGYSRAARIVDLLEERGVIGPANGSKPREVYEQATGEVADPSELNEHHE